MTSDPRRPAALTAIATVGALAVIALAGCGSATFTAEEVIAEINRHGGELDLGEPLGGGGDGHELHSLSFTGDAPAPEDVHAAGTLLIAPDEEAALAEYQRCENAASLICFRAANALLIFDGAVQRVDLARLGYAIRAMASE